MIMNNFLASGFWDKVFPKNENGEFHFMAQISGVIIITVILSFLLILLGRKISSIDPKKKTPLWLVPFVFVVEFLNNFTKQNIGKRWRFYASYFTTLAVFLFVLNISSIFGFTTPTTYICVNFGLALITFFMIQITGIVSLGFKEYLKGFVGPVPAISIVMVPLNIISEFALPISLTLRLLGNVLSGNVIVKLITGFLGTASVAVLPVLSIYFDIFSGLIQTVVFLMLTIIFTSNKIDESEKIY